MLDIPTAAQKVEVDRYKNCRAERHINLWIPASGVSDIQTNQIYNDYITVYMI